MYGHVAPTQQKQGFILNQCLKGRAATLTNDIDISAGLHHETRFGLTSDHLLALEKIALFQISE
jgi:hypothetical protein